MKSLLAIALALFTVNALAEPRPAMSINDREVLGKYKLHSPESGCQTEGRGICDQAFITKKGTQLFVEFTDGAYSIPLKQQKDVLTFSGDFQEECDNPGCGNVQSIFGIVYFKKLAGTWVRTIKVTTVVDFPYPESEEEPQGPTTSTAYLTK